MNPTSQENNITFGNIVSFPLEEPLTGTDSGPQSLAKIIQFTKHASMGPQSFAEERQRGIVWPPHNQR